MRFAEMHGWLLFRCDHFRDAAYAGVASVYVVVPIKDKVAGLDELTGPDARAVANGSDHFSVACEFEELPVLSAAHPEITLVIKLQSADEVAHRKGVPEHSIKKNI
jgi:hypothetical protein